ncbi:MAG TPA: DUF2213 domain-containing protein [Desulfosporosinus sp.]|nr:DUF2213 domain-containing protein [Desulfosporosinus sp.]
MKTKAYYGSRFSPNQTKTPEGFLICHNVPITRTGWYDYLGQELKLNDMFDMIVKVYKSPEEVFAPAAMASFEGKSVTDNHPSSEVRPDNYSSHEKGQVSNVRQGTGAESDCLLADLIIKDPTLISEIESGKREVSCGYEVDYEPLGDGKYQQVKIRGNHVAVVSAGRAGNRVAIRDEKPIEHQKPIERRKKTMKVDPSTIWGKMLSAFAKDAEPEELAEAAKMAPKSEDSIVAPAPATATVTPPQVNDEPAVDPAVAELAQKIDALTAIVAKLAEAERAEATPPPDALDELTVELGAGTQEPGEEENSVTIPAEQMEDEAPVASGGDLPTNPIPGADRNSILSAIRAIKPVIANIKDPKERKMASDALAKTFRDQLGTSRVPANGYADILAAQQAAASKAQDQKAVQEDPAQLGRDIAKKHNPHYKEAK